MQRFDKGSELLAAFQGGTGGLFQGSPEEFAVRGARPRPVGLSADRPGRSRGGSGSDEFEVLGRDVSVCRPDGYRWNKLTTNTDTLFQAPSTQPTASPHEHDRNARQEDKHGEEEGVADKELPMVLMELRRVVGDLP